MKKQYIVLIICIISAIIVTTGIIASAYTDLSSLNKVYVALIKEQKAELEEYHQYLSIDETINELQTYDIYPDSSYDLGTTFYESEEMFQRRMIEELATALQSSSGDITFEKDENGIETFRIKVTWENR